MKQYLWGALVGALLVVASMPTSFAQDNQELGSQLAKEMINLISFAEMANIGARDPDCRGTPFPVTDIDSLIQNELAPIMGDLNRVTGQLGVGERDEIITLFKQIPNQKLNGTGVVMQNYQNAKRQSVTAYGPDSACTSLSTMIQTVIHQKRLAIHNLMTQLKSR